MLNQTGAAGTAKLEKRLEAAAKRFRVQKVEVDRESRAIGEAAGTDWALDIAHWGDLLRVVDLDPDGVAFSELEDAIYDEGPKDGLYDDPAWLAGFVAAAIEIHGAVEERL